MTHDSGGRQGPERRRQEIADLVLSTGSVTAADLVERFGVSLMTIHRDLDELERQGILRKHRGGVTAQPSGVFESNVAYRMRSMRAAKEAIAERAAGLIEPGMAVMLDDSTTALALARRLPALGPLTVITNFLAAINLLAGERDVRLMGLGGDYDPLHDSFLGVACVDAIEALNVDLCFVSTSAISEGFAYHQEQHIVSVKRVMLRAAARNVLLIDHSKLNRVALHRVAPLSVFDRVIVDDGADAAALRDLDEQKVRYEVATT
ncbi:DeoR/GlpR family DNA-binding transcription regulator [Streptomyces sp. B6B3]|uniref:DeoR/GlpR family DNA-binding transcription regulator n=1 Tax=Streptomyces sp. B6B3 TaxID=3153570 RepID=UPI00325E95E5